MGCILPIRHYLICLIKYFECCVIQTKLKGLCQLPAIVVGAVRAANAPDMVLLSVIEGNVLSGGGGGGGGGAGMWTAVLAICDC